MIQHAIADPAQCRRAWDRSIVALKLAQGQAT